MLLSFLFLVPVMQLYSGYAQLLATSLATYYIAKFKIGGKRMPWLVFVLQMGHLTLNHLVRHFGNIPLTTIEITAAQMVLVMNLTTFAWDVYDGQQRAVEQCDEAQKRTRIATMPSLLEFLGYAFYFPGVMIGPSSKFSDYQKWANGELFPPSKAEKASATDGKVVNGAGGKKDLDAPPKRAPPAGRVRAALFELAVGLFFMAVYSLFAGPWDYARLTEGALAGGVRDWAWWRRILFANMAGLMARTKYYGVWTLTNVSLCLAVLARFRSRSWRC